MDYGSTCIRMIAKHISSFPADEYYPLDQTILPPDQADREGGLLSYKSGILCIFALKINEKEEKMKADSITSPIRKQGFRASMTVKW